MTAMYSDAVSDWLRAIFKPSKILDTKRGLHFTENGVGDNPISNLSLHFYLKYTNYRDSRVRIAL